MSANDTFFGYKGRMVNETQFYIRQLNYTVDTTDEVLENLSYNAAREYVEALATVNNLAKQSLRLKELIAEEAEHECHTNCEAERLMLDILKSPIIDHKSKTSQT